MNGGETLICILLGYPELRLTKLLLKEIFYGHSTFTWPCSNKLGFNPADEPEKTLLLRLEVLEDFPLPDGSRGAREQPLQAFHPPEARVD